MAKKKKSRFQKLVMVVVWVMIIATIGSVILSAAYSLMTGTGS